MFLPTSLVLAQCVLTYVCVREKLLPLGQCLWGGLEWAADAGSDRP